MQLFALALAARAEPPIPAPPERWVTDMVGFLSPSARVRLDGELETYERQSGHQVVVWIGSSIEDGDLADWAVRTFDAWNVGRAGFDDGLAVFVLAEDRTVAIEVGYGLEGVVPDATANRVIQEVMVPRLQAGDRDGAIEAGVDTILTAIEGHPVDLAPASAPSEPQPVALSTPQLVILGIGVVLFLVLLVTNPRLALGLLWSIAARGGGGMSGGSVGGGGGGFQGGGGRSGGGGARGSW